MQIYSFPETLDIDYYGVKIGHKKREPLDSLLLCQTNLIIERTVRTVDRILLRFP